MSFPSHSVVSGLPNRGSVARTVDEMLLDAGEPAAAELRAALLALGSLAALPVPEPRGALAALLARPACQPARRRLLRQHRASAVGLAVVAGMGLGVSGVAATASNPGVHAGSSVQQLLHDWAPAWTITGPSLAGRDAGYLPAPHFPPDFELEDPVTGSGALGGTAADPGAADPGAAGPRGAQQGSGEKGGFDPVGGNGAETAKPKTGDGGATGNAANVSPRGSAAQDATSREAPGHKAGRDTANGGHKVEKSGAGASAAPPARTGKAGTGNADPGLVWRKKFRP